MFIRTIKLKKPAAVVIFTVFAAALVLLAVFCVSKAAASGGSYKVETESQRQALISQLGWEVSEEPEEQKTAVIPSEFDDVYTAYNELQKEQGFDLEKYTGKSIEIYTYPVYNYEGHEDCVVLTLIAYEGELIGGDVCCTELEGFMQGLKKS